MKYFGMTTQTEQEWCRNYVEGIFTGTGEIVELGPWLGSLSISLATGLIKRKTLLSDKFIHVYDRWIWEQYMEKYKNDTVDCKVGHSFLPEYKRRVGWLLQYIDIRGDLYHEKPFEKNIELLVVDAMKTWNLTNIILRNFYSRLIPEIGYVFHQDYMFFGCPWIHMVHWVLRDYFWVQEVVPFSTTIVFRCHKPIAPELLDRTYTPEGFSEEEVREAFKYSRYSTNIKAWSEIDKAEEFMLRQRDEGLKHVIATSVQPIIDEEVSGICPPAA